VSRIQPASDLLIGADPPALDAAARPKKRAITSVNKAAPLGPSESPEGLEVAPSQEVFFSSSGGGGCAHHHHGQVRSDPDGRGKKVDRKWIAVAKFFFDLAS
jgi:hypothetical protein